MSLTINCTNFIATQETTTSSKPQPAAQTLPKEVADTTVSINNSPEANLAKLKKEGCYRSEEKFFFGLITRKAEYTYYADGKESIAEIKAKFGLKDGAIAKCNGISDDDHVPKEGKEIYFYEEDANCQAIK